MAWLSATVGSQILIGDSLVDFSLLGISNFNFGGMYLAFLLYLIGVLAILFIFYAVNAIAAVKNSRQRA
jgi:hypothetical protein